MKDERGNMRLEEDSLTKRPCRLDTETRRVSLSMVLSVLMHLMIAAAIVIVALHVASQQEPPKSGQISVQILHASETAPGTLRSAEAGGDPPPPNLDQRVVGPNDGGAAESKERANAAIKEALQAGRQAIGGAAEREIAEDAARRKMEAAKAAKAREEYLKKAESQLTALKAKTQEVIESIAAAEAARAEEKARMARAEAERARQEGDRRRAEAAQAAVRAHEQAARKAADEARERRERWARWKIRWDDTFLGPERAGGMLVVMHWPSPNKFTYIRDLARNPTASLGPLPTQGYPFAPADAQTRISYLQVCRRAGITFRGSGNVVLLIFPPLFEKILRNLELQEIRRRGITDEARIATTIFDLKPDATVTVFQLIEK